MGETLSMYVAVPAKVSMAAAAEEEEEEEEEWFTILLLCRPTFTLVLLVG